jgi:hypothetical protein
MKENRERLEDWSGRVDGGWNDREVIKKNLRMKGDCIAAVCICMRYNKHRLHFKPLLFADLLSLC